MFELQSSPQTDETVVTSGDGHGFFLKWPADIGNAPLIGGCTIISFKLVQAILHSNRLHKTRIMTIADLHISDQQNLIGGNWTPARDGQTIPVFCPSDGKPFCSLAASSAADIDAAVTTARLEFEEGSWSKLTATARGRLLTNLANEISRNHDRLAELEARDTGKPISQAHADIDAATRYCEFYGGAADKLHGEVIPYLDGFQVQAIREPFGVTGHIIPWNYPAQMFGRSVAASLAAGNCIVLKPAEDASLTPLLLAQLAMDMGFPNGAVNVVTGRGKTAGAALAAHPGIDFISFTGSPETGACVQAAAAQNHIGCTLELGGKSPQILFEDADIEAAVPAIIRGIIQNGGQTCSAGSRALVQTAVFDTVLEKLAAQIACLNVGPHDEDLDLGPLISQRQKRRVETYMKQSGITPVAIGCISETAPAGGHYVAPTLYGPIEPDLPLAQEEIFGPVLSCLRFTDEEDAIRLANATNYGLVAGVWTADGGRQMRMAKSLRCGQVFINCFGAGGGIELPFGGRGKSGHGREKGFESLREFTQLKTIVQHHG